jgi:hypothetical protein
MRQHVRRPETEEQAGNTSAKCQQQAFSKELPHDAPPSSAQCRTYRNFAPAPGRLRQHQVGDVRARQQQKQRHHSQQHAGELPHFLPVLGVRGAANYAPMFILVLWVLF